MYWLGVTTLSLTHGSSIVSMSVGLGQQRRVVDDDRAAAVRELDVVLDRRRRRDEVEVELALEALLDDLHVEQAEEPAAEPEPERDRALRLEREARVVEVQLLERLAQQRVVLAADRVDARRTRGSWPPGSRAAARSAGRAWRRERVADLRLADVLEPGRDVADLAGDELLDRDELRPEDAELERLGARRRWPSAGSASLALSVPCGQPDVDDHALVGVVVAVEDQALDAAPRDRPWAPGSARRSPRGCRRRRCRPWRWRG